MPTGSRMRSIGGETDSPTAASTSATFSTKKLKYLKNPSIPKFEMMLSHRKPQAVARATPPSRARRSSRSPSRLRSGSGTTGWT